MMTIDKESAIAALAGCDDVRVLRRFVPRERYAAAPADPRSLRAGLYVDVETTGLDTATDQIIELALLPFEFDSDGTVYAVGKGLWCFNDPGVPIPLEVTALTGISDEMVCGQSLNHAAIAAVLRSAALVVAHNADFDRRILERHVDGFQRVSWACSYREVDWSAFGCVGAKMQHVLADTCHEFYDAHRALDDCRVGVHVLAAAERQGRTALSYLLESARQPTVRIWAVGAPYGVKDKLKARGYKWCDGSEGRTKAWYRDMRLADYVAEREWLSTEAFVDDPPCQTFDATDRYSARMLRAGA